MSKYIDDIQKGIKLGLAKAEKSVTDDPITRARPLLDFIAKGEGGYEAANNGTAKGKIVGSTQKMVLDGKPLSQWTIGEIKAEQKKLRGERRIFAVGRYQIIPETMPIAQKAAGLSDDDLFTPENQDKLGYGLLAGDKRPKLAKYLRGESDDVDGAMLDFAKEWASIPDPRTGKSYYGQGNKSSHTVDEVRAALTGARTPGKKFEPPSQVAMAGVLGKPPPVPDFKPAADAITGFLGNAKQAVSSAFSDLPQISAPQMPQISAPDLKPAADAISGFLGNAGAAASSASDNLRTSMFGQEPLSLPQISAPDLKPAADAMSSFLSGLQAPSTERPEAITPPVVDAPQSITPQPTPAPQPTRPPQPTRLPEPGDEPMIDRAPKIKLTRKPEERPPSRYDAAQLSALDMMTDRTWLQAASLIGADQSNVPSVQAAPADAIDAFNRGATSGTIDMGVQIDYARAGLESAMGNTDQMNIFMERAKRNEQRIADIVGPTESLKEFFEEPTIDGFFEKVGLTLGQVTPSILATITTAFATGGTSAVVMAAPQFAGKTVAVGTMKKMVKEAVVKKAKGLALDESEEKLLAGAYQAIRAARGQAFKSGATAGAFATEYPQMTGASFREFEQAGVDLNDPNYGRASLAIGGGLAAIGVFGERLIVEGAYELATKKASRLSSNQNVFALAAKDIAALGLRSAAAEGTTEALQEGALVGQRFAVDPDYSVEDAKWRVAEAGFAGALAGGALGGGAGAFTGAARALSVEPPVSTDRLRKEREVISTRTLGAAFGPQRRLVYKDEYLQDAKGLLHPKVEAEMRASDYTPAEKTRFESVLAALDSAYTDIDAGKIDVAREKLAGARALLDATSAKKTAQYEQVQRLLRESFASLNQASKAQDPRTTAQKIMDKAKATTQVVRDKINEGRMDAEETGMSLDGPTQESLADYEAQIAHLAKTLSPKSGVWLPENSFFEVDVETPLVDYEPVKTDNVWAVKIPGQGVLMTRYKSDATKLALSAQENSGGFERMLARVLGYSAVKPDDADRAVAVQDADGNIISEEATNEAGERAAVLNADKIAAAAGNGATVVTRDLKDALRSRRDRAEAEPNAAPESAQEEPFTIDPSVEENAQFTPRAEQSRQQDAKQINTDELSAPDQEVVDEGGMDDGPIVRQWVTGAIKRMVAKLKRGKEAARAAKAAEAAEAAEAVDTAINRLRDEEEQKTNALELLRQKKIVDAYLEDPDPITISGYIPPIVAQALKRMYALVPLQKPLIVLSTADSSLVETLRAFIALGVMSESFMPLVDLLDSGIDIKDVGIGGAFFPGVADLNIMLLDSSFDPGTVAFIAAHEYAHAVFAQAYAGHKGRLAAEFRVSKTGQEFEARYKAIYDDAYADQYGNLPDAVLEEWFADQLAAYALSPERNPTGFNKFLAEVIEQIRAVFNEWAAHAHPLFQARAKATDAFAEFIEQAIPAGVFAAPVDPEAVRRSWAEQSAAMRNWIDPSVRNMSTNTGQLGEGVPAYIAESEAVAAAVKKARDSVRELLTKLNFKFEETPDLSLSDLERVASKYLTGLHNDDPAFLDDAAKALSYALYTDINESVDVNIPRPVIEKALRSWLENGKPPKIDRTIWTTIVQSLNKLMSIFSGKEFATIESVLEKTITDITTGRDFSFKPKQGFEKLSFQKEMDNNPLAVQVLTSLRKSGIPFSLTGSVAYADQVPVYRKAGSPLHDVDLLLDPEDLDAAFKWFSEGDPENWGDVKTMYTFFPGGKKTVGIAAVPAGYEIRNLSSIWNVKANNPQRSYDVYNKETGEKVGSYFFLRGSRETFEGIAGITIDLLAEPKQAKVPQSFTHNGETITLDVASYVGGFAAKLIMLRPKDVADFKAVVPPKRQTDGTADELAARREKLFGEKLQAILESMSEEDRRILQEDVMDSAASVKSMLPSVMREDYNEWKRDAFNEYEYETLVGEGRVNEAERQFLEETALDSSHPRKKLAEYILAGGKMGPQGAPPVRNMSTDARSDALTTVDADEVTDGSNALDNNGQGYAPQAGGRDSNVKEFKALVAKYITDPATLAELAKFSSKRDDGAMTPEFSAAITKALFDAVITDEDMRADFAEYEDDFSTSLISSVLKAIEAEPDAYFFPVVVQDETGQDRIFIKRASTGKTASQMSVDEQIADRVDALVKAVAKDARDSKDNKKEAFPGENFATSIVVTSSKGKRTRPSIAQLIAIGMKINRIEGADALFLGEGMSPQQALKAGLARAVKELALLGYTFEIDPMPQQKAAADPNSISARAAPQRPAVRGRSLQLNRADLRPLQQPSIFPQLKDQVVYYDKNRRITYTYADVIATADAQVRQKDRNAGYLKAYTEGRRKRTEERLIRQWMNARRANAKRFTAGNLTGDQLALAQTIYGDLSAPDDVSPGTPLHDKLRDFVDAKLKVADKEFAQNLRDREIAFDPQDMEGVSDPDSEAEMLRSAMQAYMEENPGEEVVFENQGLAQQREEAAIEDTGPELKGPKRLPPNRVPMDDAQRAAAVQAAESELARLRAEPETPTRNAQIIVQRKLLSALSDTPAQRTTVETEETERRAVYEGAEKDLADRAELLAQMRPAAAAALRDNVDLVRESHIAILDAATRAGALPYMQVFAARRNNGNNTLTLRMAPIPVKDRPADYADKLRALYGALMPEAASRLRNKINFVTNKQLNNFYAIAANDPSRLEINTGEGGIINISRAKWFPGLTTPIMDLQRFIFEYVKDPFAKILDGMAARELPTSDSTIQLVKEVDRLKAALREARAGLSFDMRTEQELELNDIILRLQKDLRKKQDELREARQSAKKNESGTRTTPKVQTPTRNASFNIHSAVPTIVNRVLTVAHNLVAPNKPVDVFTASDFEAGFQELVDSGFIPADLVPVFQQQLASMRGENGDNVYGALVFRGRYVILLNDLREGSAVDDAVMAIAAAHEMGHILFIEEFGNIEMGAIPENIEKGLLDGYTQFVNEQRANRAEVIPFEEWFSDQVGIFAYREASGEKQKRSNEESRVARNKPLTNDRMPADLVAYLKGIADKLKKLFNAVNKLFGGRMRQSQQFVDYFESVVVRRKKYAAPPTTLIGVAYRNMAQQRMVNGQPQQQLASKIADDANNLLKDFMKDPIDTLKRTVYATDDYLRQMGPAGVELAQFFRGRSQSKEDTGFHSAKIFEQHRWFSKLADAIGIETDKLTTDEIDTILFEAEDNTIPTARLTRKAQAVRKVFDDMYEQYITYTDANGAKKKWFAVKKAENYNPRQINTANVAIEPTGFANWLAANGFESQSDANAIAAYLAQQAGSIMPAGAGPLDAPMMPHGKARSLSQIPTKALRDALMPDGSLAPGADPKYGWLVPPQMALTQYIHFTARKVEFERRGGKTKLEGLVAQLPEEKQADAVKALEANLGKLGDDIRHRPAARQFNSITQVTTAITTLTFAVFASLPDLAGVAMRSKDFSNFMDVMRQFKRTLTDKQNAELARSVGVVTSQALDSIFMSPGEMDYTAPWAKKIMEKFFVFNGTDAYTRFARTFATGMGREFLVNTAFDPAFGPQQERWLSELGVTRDEITSWHASGQPLSDLTPGTRDHAIANAIARFAEEAVIRPDSSIKPGWASNPYYNVIWQLKTYFYAYGKTIVAGMAREFKNRIDMDGDAMGAIAQLSMAIGGILILTAVGLEAREWTKYLLRAFIPWKDSEDALQTDTMDLGQYSAEIVERSGLLGPFALATSAMEGLQREGWFGPVIATVPAVDFVDDSVFDGEWDRVLPVINNL